MVIFSGVCVGVTYLIVRIQGSLPLNPQHLGAVPQALSWNTSVSFMTNTNWQNYGGETTMSYFSQIGALTFEQFVSPAIGIAVAIGMVRGFSRRNSPTIGNFWVDMTRGLLYIFFPIAFIVGHHHRRAGCGPDAGRHRHHPRLPERRHPDNRPRARSASCKSIMQLGNNGGGFLNANSATTFENPTGFTNFMYIFLLLCIPFSLTYTFGKMVGSIRHGAALLAAMVIIFGVWVGGAAYYEHQNNPAVAAAGVSIPPSATPRARRCASATTTSALFGVSSTSTSTGSAEFLLRLIHPDGRLLPHQRDDARRGDAGWHRQRPLHHPHLRHHRRLHRWADDRANAGVPRQEDPSQGR